MAWKRRETFYFLIDSYLKDTAFTTVNRKGYLFREKWYINGKELVLGGGASPYKHFLSNLPPGFSCCTGLRGIDLFSLYVLYSRTQRSQGNLTLCLFVRTYAHEQDEIWKKQFSRVLSHDLYCENKTYNLKRSIREVKHQMTSNGKRKFVPRDQVFPLQYWLVVYCSLFQHINQSSFTQCFIHNNCFWSSFILLISYFSTWIWRLPYTSRLETL